MSDRDMAIRMQPWLHLSGPLPSVEHIELFGETPDGQPILEKKMKK